MELRQKHGIVSPIIKTLMAHANMDLLVYAFRNVLGNQQMKFKEIARGIDEKYGYKDSWTRKQLALLTTKRLVQRSKRARECLYSMT
jgi:hypothetical protein